MEDNDIVESSEQTGDTPVAEESTSQVEASGAESQESASESKQEEKLAPFHEHPRFKEVIEQNRSYKDQIEQTRTQVAQYQAALERLQGQMEMLKPQATKPEPVKDPFLADLEKVNPVYAKSLQPVYDSVSRTQQLEQRLQQYEQQQVAREATSKFNNLLETSKVTDPMDRELYERVVRAEVYEQEARGKKLNLNDLESIFNAFHTKYSKAMEERNRKLTASYVKEKAKDTSPKGATGGIPASPTTKKIAAGDLAGQTKWLADQIRSMKKTI